MTIQEIEQGRCSSNSCKGHGHLCCHACDLNKHGNGIYPACTGCDYDPETCGHFCKEVSSNEMV